MVRSQYTSMNIADRHRLYSEMYRVLRPGGRVAMNDVVSVADQKPHFPAPWAETEATSHLLTVEATGEVLKAVGFAAPLVHDITPVNLAQMANPLQPIGFQFTLDSHAREMGQNIRRSLEEGRGGTGPAGSGSPVTTGGHLEPVGAASAPEPNADPLRLC